MTAVHTQPISCVDILILYIELIVHWFPVFCGKHLPLAKSRCFQTGLYVSHGYQVETLLWLFQRMLGCYFALQVCFPLPKWKHFPLNVLWKKCYMEPSVLISVLGQEAEEGLLFRGCSRAPQLQVPKPFSQCQNSPLYPVSQFIGH